MNSNICKPCFLGILLLIVSEVRGQDSSCGGILNGTTGTAGFIASPEEVTRSACIWIISPDEGSEVAFTLKDISADSSILFYEVGKSAPLTILGQDNIESSITYAGKGFLVIFPVKTGSKVSFEWQINGIADESLLFEAIYSEKDSDQFLREHSESNGSFALVASLEQKYEVTLRINLLGLVESPECEDPCECLNVDAFQVLPSGRLGRLTQDRLCRGDRYDKIELNPQVVIWGNFKVPQPEADFMTFFANWWTTLSPPDTTDSTPTTPDSSTPDFANTIFANKALVLVGLFALYLSFQRYTS